MNIACCRYVVSGCARTCHIQGGSSRSTHLKFYRSQLCWLTCQRPHNHASPTPASQSNDYYCRLLPTTILPTTRAIPVPLFSPSPGGLHPRLPLRRQGRLQQEDSRRSWTIERLWQDRRPRYQRSESTRQSARRVQRWADTGLGSEWNQRRAPAVRTPPPCCSKVQAVF